MTTYEVGQTIYFSLKVYDSTGALADLGGGNPTCTVTLPDGTTTTATVTKNSVGYYQGALTSAQAGRYRGTFTGTGANGGALPFTDVVDVWPADPRLIISLADARAALNLASTNRTNDDELRLYIAAATPIIEDIVGAVLTTTRTDTFDGGRDHVLLMDIPSSITTVTVDGTATTSYVANLSSGIVFYGASKAPLNFPDGIQNVVVTYATGSSTIDPNIILAAREEVRFLYQIGQQGGRPSLGGTVPDLGWTPSGFAVPKRVIELCTPSIHRSLPNF